MLWSSTATCTVTSFSTHFINMDVTDGTVPPWRLTCYYGLPDQGRRKESWALLRSLAAAGDGPLCVIGDINDLLHNSDKKGSVPRLEWMLNGFRDTVRDCDLIDLHLEGHPYTWRKSLGTPSAVEERLDRALANAD